MIVDTNGVITLFAGVDRIPFYTVLVLCADRRCRELRWRLALQLELSGFLAGCWVEAFGGSILQLNCTKRIPLIRRYLLSCRRYLLSCIALRLIHLNLKVS